MAKKATKEIDSGKALDGCKTCKRWKEIKERLRIAELLASAIDGFEKNLKAGHVKPTVGDYLKLVQMEKEFEQEDIREIKVTWVESPAGSKS